MLPTLRAILNKRRDYLQKLDAPDTDDDSAVEHDSDDEDYVEQGDDEFQGGKIYRFESLVPQNTDTMLPLW